jgi:hypothetical protein
MTIVMQDPVYVGVGVCAHNADALEEAVFSQCQDRVAFAARSEKEVVAISTALTPFPGEIQLPKILFSASGHVYLVAGGIGFLKPGRLNFCFRSHSFSQVIQPAIFVNPVSRAHAAQPASSYVRQNTDILAINSLEYRYFYLDNAQTRDAK